MGLIDRTMGFVFGGGTNVIRETVEVFKENTEGTAQRQADLRAAVMAQFAAEFATQSKTRFDCFIDAINRIPRPAMALGTLALFLAAMFSPEWFAIRMRGIALVPEPLWWLMGAIVSFYFGARHQTKGQELQRSIAEALARFPSSPVEQTKPPERPLQDSASEASVTPGNKPLDDWRAERGQ